MTFGMPGIGGCDEEPVTRLVHRYIDAGGNFIDIFQSWLRGATGSLRASHEELTVGLELLYVVVDVTQAAGLGEEATIVLMLTSPSLTRGTPPIVCFAKPCSASR